MQITLTLNGIKVTEDVAADMLLIDSPDPILVFAVITIILFVLSKDMTLRFYDRAGGV